MTKTERPRVNSEGQRELDKIEREFEEKKEAVQAIDLNKLNSIQVENPERQTEVSQIEKEKSKDIYLKPIKSIGVREKFNEKFRKKYEYAKEYVCFTAENMEIKGEDIEIWTKRFQGQPAEYWKVPVNKAVWGPRYLAEQIANCKYTVYSMDQKTITGADGMGTYHGGIVAEKRVQRLNAHPENQNKSVFMSKF